MQVPLSQHYYRQSDKHRDEDLRYHEHVKQRHPQEYKLCTLCRFGAREDPYSTWPRVIPVATAPGTRWQFPDHDARWPVGQGNHEGAPLLVGFDPQPLHMTSPRWRPNDTSDDFYHSFMSPRQRDYGCQCLKKMDHRH
eukprot:GEMP01074884.1.p1 GENE.GEMP01074884.1~~GEMP01074884.1.p1  ORF type:complete len:158 (+),score=28.99 GEMP01074884.1:61-474(+)